MTTGRVGRNPTLAVALLLMGAPGLADAGGRPRRLRELAPDDGTPRNVWSPRGLAWGSKALLDFDGTPVGREPWVSDGTPAGTYLLADLLPSDGGSEVFPLPEVAKRIFFSVELPVAAASSG